MTDTQDPKSETDQLQADIEELESFLNEFQEDVVEEGGAAEAVEIPTDELLDLELGEEPEQSAEAREGWEQEVGGEELIPEVSETYLEAPAEQGAAEEIIEQSPVEEEVPLEEAPAEQGAAEEIIEETPAEVDTSEFSEAAPGEGETAADSDLFAGLGEEEFELGLATAEATEGDTMPEEQAAGAEAVAAEPAEVPAAPIPPAAAEPQGPDKLTLAALAIALLAVIGGGIAGWWANGLSGELAAVRDELQGLKTAMPQAAAGGMDIPAAVAGLEGRLDKLAATMEGPMGHLLKTNKQELNDFQERLEEVEGALAEVSQKLAAGGAPGAAPVASGGGWVINLQSLSRPGMAEKELARLQGLDIPAEIHRVSQDGEVWYRLRVTGFGSAEEARAYSREVVGKAGLAGVWVGRL